MAEQPAAPWINQPDDAEPPNPLAIAGGFGMIDRILMTPPPGRAIAYLNGPNSRSIRATIAPRVCDIMASTREIVAE